MLRPDLLTLAKAKSLEEPGRQVFEWLRFCLAPTLLGTHMRRERAHPQRGDNGRSVSEAHSSPTKDTPW